MHVLYFGTYRKDYGRNRITIDGLRQNGVQVTECHAALWQGMADREQVARGGWLKPSFWLRALRAYWRLLAQYRQAGPYDILFVGYPGHYDVFLARLLAWTAGKPLVWDVFNSMYLMASERGIVEKHPLTGRLIRTFEWLAARLPDRLFLDSEAFVDWFCELYGLDKSRFRLVPIGVDTGVFQQAPVSSAPVSSGPVSSAPGTSGPVSSGPGVDPARDTYRVLYYGTYIPNHGVDLIVEAARLLAHDEQIQFEMVGDGPDCAKARALAQSYGLQNLHFTGWLEKHEMAARVADCDVCLGGFGDTLQASLTNNNKIYEAFALSKPVITGRTPSMPEMLHHKEHLFLVERGSPQSLVDAITTLRDNPDLAQRLGENGRLSLAHGFNVASIGEMIKGHLQELTQGGEDLGGARGRRVLFLLTQDLESPSGLGRYFPVAKALVERGYTVTVAALHADLASLPQRRFQQEGVDVWYVAQMHVRKRDSVKSYFPAYQLLGLVAWSTLRLAWAALTIPADIIHIGKPHPMNSLAGLAGRLRGRRLFLDCDDDETESAHYTGRWQRAILAFFEKNTPRWARAVTTNTFHSRDRLLARGVPHQKICYVSNGIDRTRFTLPDPRQVGALRGKLDLLDRPVVAFIGSLSRPSHPVELLFRAFQRVHERLPGAALLLVGGGEDYESLQALAQEMGIGSAVRFAGRCLPEEVPAYYALADVSTDPVYDNSTARGRSPLKLFESWACGVPFVSCDVGDRRHVLGDPPAGLLASPGDPDALAQAILNVLLDPELADALSSRGYERVEMYTWDQLVSTFVALYNPDSQ